MRQYRRESYKGDASIADGTLSSTTVGYSTP